MRTDLGSVFDGDTVHYRPDGVHASFVELGARHRFNPPARPNANADVKSSHATIENDEFFDLENFADPAHFLAAATAYQLLQLHPQESLPRPPPPARPAPLWLPQSARYAEKNPGVIRVACFAHARRKFNDALKTAPIQAAFMLRLIGHLCRMERDWDEL